MLHFHVACPCCTSMLHFRAVLPCCTSVLHVHVACSCCISNLLVNGGCLSCMSILHFYSCMPILHVHAADPCCMSMLHVHAPCSCHIQHGYAACPSCVRVAFPCCILFHALCPSCISFSHVHAAYPWSMSMPHAQATNHAACPCHMPILYVYVHGSCSCLLAACPGCRSAELQFLRSGTAYPQLFLVRISATG
jgi:hypothetical protein